ncbi:hypothetical protein PRIPAC_94510 [Pristionchus pacificus]|uniref:Uncharacterized protein n=1 Tax=Pristionchus pacificus TaxID=54126 RepID=A0A2A6C960_PRIPA|nr:hypothetical protein PRIPAC_94510 [Pristionchus pacificus]|eukprot:PDM74742.1 hypothetical protein PRIPAC_43693 [Pristionchus pacificus]
MDCLKACLCGYANRMDEESTKSVESLEVPVQEQPQVHLPPIVQRSVESQLFPHDLPRVPTRRQQHPIQVQALAQPQLQSRPPTRRRLPAFIERDEVHQVEKDVPGLYATSVGLNEVEVEEVNDHYSPAPPRTSPPMADRRVSHEELLAESLGLGSFPYVEPTVLRGTGRLDAVNSTDHPNMVIGAAPMVIVVAPKKRPSNSTFVSFTGR